MKCERRMRGVVIDGVVGVCLLAVAAGFGYHHLHAHVGMLGKEIGDYSPQMFEPAVLFASGRELVEIPLVDLPELRAFIAQEKPEFDPRSLPDQLPAPVPLMNKGLPYLLYAAGSVWWLLGISWEALKVLPAVALGISVAVLYGVFRLGANRFLSVLGALLFLSSPGVIKMLPCVRDFCKTPFILTAILLMGCLVRAPMRLRAYWTLSAMLGIVIGIGSGFRQDLVIFVVPGLFAVAAGAWGAARISMAGRAGAVALLIAGYLGPAWPILANMREGYIEQSPHLMQGFSTECVQDLGVGKSSYSFIYTKHDNYIYATQHSYDERVNGQAADRGDKDECELNAASAGRRWVAQVIRSFPADTVTRFYATVLWSLGRSADDGLCETGWRQFLIGPLAEHLASYGPFYAAIALLFLSGRSLGLAWRVFVIGVFVCGYVGLLFESRHTFHLCFVPFWVAALCIDKAFDGARKILDPLSRQRIVAQCHSLRGAWWLPARRMLLFGGGVSALVLVPFWGARLYQHSSVASIVKCYRSATLEPVATRKTPDGDWVFIEPERRLPSLDRSSEGPRMDVATEYCVAEFASNAGTFPMQLRYRPDPSTADISGTVKVRAAGTGANETTKYFFPVYEFWVPGTSPDSLTPMYAGGRGRFTGVAIPKARAAQFKGFYRVRNIEAFPILMMLSLPDDERFLRRYRRLLFGPTYQSRLGSRYLAQGRVDKAVTAFRRAHAYEPFDDGITANLASAINMTAEHLVRRGEREKALAAYREAFAFNPDDDAARSGFVMALLAMGRDFEQRGEWEEALASYCDIESVDSGNVAALYAKADLYERRGGMAGAAATYLRIIATHPEESPAFSKLEDLYTKQGTDIARPDAVRAVTELHPTECRAYGLLGKTLELEQEYADAIDAYQKASELGCRDAAASDALTRTLMAYGKQLTEAKEPGKALEVYRRVLVAKPDDVAALFGEAHTLEELGNMPGAIATYRRAIGVDTTPREQYMRLDMALLRQNKPDERVVVWRDITKALPNAFWAYVYLGCAMEAVQDYEGEVEAYRAAHALDPSNVAAEVGLGMVLMRTFHYKEACDTLESALSREPGLPAGDYEALISMLTAQKDYDRAWQYVDRCKARGIEVAASVLEVLARDSRRSS